MWAHPSTDEVLTSIRYELGTTNMRSPWVCLVYTMTQSQQRLDYRIFFQTTRPHFGGVRWWFVCPLLVHGQACRHWVTTLYLPPGEPYFGCRHCYDLTYSSCQEREKRVRWSRQYSERYLARLRGGTEKAPTSRLLLALKVVRDLS